VVASTAWGPAHSGNQHIGVPLPVTGNAPGKKLVGIEGRPYTGSFAPSGEFAAVAAADCVMIWDVREAPEDVVRPAVVAGGRGRVSSTHHIATRTFEPSLGRDLLVLCEPDASMYGASFSSDGAHVVTCSDRSTTVWDAFSGQALMTYGPVESYDLTPDFFPDGHRIITQRPNYSCAIEDWTTGNTVLEFPDIGGIVSVDISSDGAYLATGHGNGTAAIWNASTGKRLRVLDGHQKRVNVCFSPDGKTLATGCWDGLVKIWGVATGQNTLSIPAHSLNMVWVCFSPDGTRIGTASWDKTAKIWDSVTGEKLLTLGPHPDYVKCVAFSPDGQRVLTTAMGVRPPEYVFRIWDALTGEEKLSIVAHEGKVWNGSFSPYGTRMATASWDGTVKMWDALPWWSDAWFDERYQARLIRAARIAKATFSRPQFGLTKKADVLRSLEEFVNALEREEEQQAEVAVRPLEGNGIMVVDDRICGIFEPLDLRKGDLITRVGTTKTRDLSSFREALSLFLKTAKATDSKPHVLCVEILNYLERRIVKVELSGGDKQARQVPTPAQQSGG